MWGDSVTLSDVMENGTCAVSLPNGRVDRECLKLFIRAKLGDAEDAGRLWMSCISDRTRGEARFRINNLSVKEEGSTSCRA